MHANSIAHQPAMGQVRAKLRRLLGRAIRSSPASVQGQLRRACQRLLRVLDPPAVAHHVSTPPPVPAGTTLDQLEATYRSWSVNGEPPGHLDAYVDDSFWRFLQTWSLVRDDTGSCLELGANPYFTTFLLETYTALELTMANYYGRTDADPAKESVSYVVAGSTERAHADRITHLFNVEEDEFPFSDDSFDVVLFCEMLEHLLMNPVATLRQIHRVLKPNGVLVLTTPNVCRLGNVAAIVEGVNIYDPYSGFGPYGRHNREYTRHELHVLLGFAGFDVETSFTADGHLTLAPTTPHASAVVPELSFRQPDLGHYLFVRARATRPPREGLPDFLYRSWPEGCIVPTQ
jgi:SAM-dependent methyltransferase